MNICFIGFGNMAKAIAHGLNSTDLLAVHACSPSLREGRQSDGIYTHNDNNAVIEMMDVVVLAVKPQLIKSVLPSLALSKNSVLLSIAAGVTLDQLSRLAPKHQPIIRAMPNTPISVGYGATQLVANAYCSHENKNKVDNIFSHSGIYVWLETEELIDAYTGLSGSGPAYIFYLLECLIEGAQKLGIDKAHAREYAEQTMLGALKLSQKSQLPLETLRQQVTSPGGATAEALKVMEMNHLNTIIAEAMAASCNKAKQLSESAQ
ncbi:pyrroline-5-carboxylate reductase [Legionella sp. W05-934-2]|uniref:pyrroline-5-carboxylate reductase n=1 Tax=Legionella sp. W05-934-2 TaxID=1198649 RepID=UPI003462BE59